MSDMSKILNMFLISGYAIIIICLLVSIISLMSNYKKEKYRKCGNQILKSKCNGLFGCCSSNCNYSAIGGLAYTGLQYSAYIQPNCCFTRSRNYNTDYQDSDDEDCELVVGCPSLEQRPIPGV